DVLMAEISIVLDGGYRFRQGDVQTAIRVAIDNPDTSLADFFLAEGLLPTARRMVQPRTVNQQAYMKAMLDHDIVISIGPAGTGKTYLAVAMAAAALLSKKERGMRPVARASE